MISRGQTTIATTTTLNILATLCVILRVISRFLVLRKPSADDYLIVVGLLMSWSLTGLTIARESFKTLFMILTEHNISEVHYGLGQHQEQVSAADLQNMFLVSRDEPLTAQQMTNRR